MKAVILLCLVLLWNVLLAAEPTKSRDWESRSGHQVRAAAIGYEKGEVALRKENGKVVRVELGTFCDADQEFLRKHFAIPDERTPEPGSGAKPAEGLAYPLGQIKGPIDAGGGASYHVYLPTSLKEGRRAPLIFFCAPWGGKNPGFIRGVTDCADRFGWVVALSVNSSNANSSEKNTAFCQQSLEHIFSTLPVDENRIHYAGHSGGALQSFLNSHLMPAFGIMASGGFIAGGKPQTELVYGICGGYDFNRRGTAVAVSMFRKNGFHRISHKGHARSPDSYREDGIFWMSCRYLGGRKDEHPEEIKDFENAALTWLLELKESNPMRAYSNAVFFRDYYQPEGHNGRALELLIQDLEKDPDNPLYHEALLALDEFSEKYLVKSRSGQGLLDPVVVRAAEKLKDPYGRLEEINDVLEALMKRCDSLKK